MNQPDLKVLAQVADLLHRTVGKLVTNAQGAHPETRIAAAGRMAGTMLHRALDPDTSGLQPGSVVALGGADKQGPMLMETLFATLRQLGHEGIDQQALRNATETTAASRLSLADTQQMLEPWYRKAGEVSGLSLRALAAAAAMAAALQIHDCRDSLDPSKACGIALHGIVEGLKTVPVPFPAPAGDA